MHNVPRKVDTTRKKCFIDINGRKEICPKLSDRVMMFKTEKKEVTEMCELMEKERLAGRKEERNRLIVDLVDKLGMSFEDACRFMEIPQEEIEEYHRKAKL